MENCLTLSGIVSRTPLCKISPSGIPHCQFLIEHQSLQKEADLYRKAWCQIPIILSGKKNQMYAYKIVVGIYITVQGFISCHKTNSGLTKIVLHAQQIKLIKRLTI